MTEPPERESQVPGTPAPPTTEELPVEVRGEYRRPSYWSPAQDEEPAGDGFSDGPAGRPAWRAGPDDGARHHAPAWQPLPGPDNDSDPYASPGEESTTRVRSGPGSAQPEPASPTGGTSGYRAPGTPSPGQSASTPAASPASAPLRVVPPPAQGLPRSAEGAVKIGLWGSPQSGKTTYLAALRHAAGTGVAGSGAWNIFPGNVQSADLLVRFARDLVTNHQFPDSTILNNPVPLQWLFVGDVTKTRFDHRKWRRGQLESKFLLDLIDVNGEAFADVPSAQVPSAVPAQALDHLTSAQGLIYLFDPIGERENRNASEYVNRTVVELQQRYAANGLASTYLPHHVAVCITKFDHPKVFQQARDLGLVNQGPDGMPRVRDEHAEQFFDALCSGDFWSERDEGGQASAQFVRGQLRSVFHPRKVRYYVTSSIGFRQPPGWTPSAVASTSFDPDDFANYYEKANGMAGIRGAIRPINVLEPLITLVQQIDARA